MANVRIKDLTTDSALAAGDYVVIDSASEGSRKFDLGTEISGLKSDIEQLDGLSDDVKQALLQIASKVAYIDDDGQDYYDALELALYPQATLVSISAEYTQSGTVYDTDTLDSLKTDLVVTAHYDDQTTAVVTAYTLSGTLADGTSTITVSYNGKTTTFDVTVTACLYPLTNGVYNSSNGEYKFTITNGHHIKVEVLNNYTGTSAHFVMLNGYTGDISISDSASINNKATLFTIPANKIVTLKMENVVNSANGGAYLCMTIALLRNANTTTSFLATSEDAHTTDQTVTKTPEADSPVGAFGFGINGQKYAQGAYFECDIVVTVDDDVYIGGAS